MIKTFLKKYWLTIAGITAGAIAGYLYWLYVGCVTGNCPITASPVNSTIWGAALGGLLFNTFKK